MPTVTYNGLEYQCNRATKGSNYIELFDSSNVSICRFDGIKNFSGFSIRDGSWEAPDGAFDIRGTATLSGTDLVVVSTDDVGEGSVVKFKAPCNCAAATGVMILNSVRYEMVDALDNPIAGREVWCKDAMVSFIVSPKDKKAFIQNQALRGSVVRWEDIWVPTTAWVGNQADIAVANMFETDNPHSVDIVRSGDSATVHAYEVAFSKIDQITTYDGGIKLRTARGTPGNFMIRMEGTR